MSKNGRDEKDPAAALAGLAVVGLLTCGVIGIWHTFDSGSAIGLVASAISFGVITVVAFL